MKPDLTSQRIEEIIERFNYEDPTERWLITDNEVRAMAKLAIIGLRAVQEPSEKVVQAALDEYAAIKSTEYVRMALAITAALDELKKEGL